MRTTELSNAAGSVSACQKQLLARGKGVALFKALSASKYVLSSEEVAEGNGEPMSFGKGCAMQETAIASSQGPLCEVKSPLWAEQLEKVSCLQLVGTHEVTWLDVAGGTPPGCHVPLLASWLKCLFTGLNLHALWLAFHMVWNSSVKSKRSMPHWLWVIGSGWGRQLCVVLGKLIRILVKEFKSTKGSVKWMRSTGEKREV